MVVRWAGRSNANNGYGEGCGGRGAMGSHCVMGGRCAMVGVVVVVAVVMLGGG